MAEPHNEGQTPERYEDTVNPRNPPNSVTNNAVRSTALKSYLGPLVVLFIVVGLALVYWANRGPVYDGVEEGRVGTTGDTEVDAIGERGGAGVDTPGGFEPAGRPDSTRDELEARGVGSPDADLPGLVAGNTLSDLRQMLNGDPKTMLGRRVDVSDARVIDAQSATMFWIQKDDAKVAVSAPQNGTAPRNGDEVTISGIVEPNGQGGVRIRATRVTTD
jgi:hypothetical protein